VEEIYNRRLGKLRRRLGESIVHDFRIASHPALRHKRPGPRIVASEGEEDSDTSSDSSNEPGPAPGPALEDEMIFATSETIAEDEEERWEALHAPRMHTPRPHSANNHQRRRPPSVTLRRFTSAHPPGPIGSTVASSPFDHLHVCSAGVACDGTCDSRTALHRVPSSAGSKKRFSRRWFKEKGGKRWEERDVNEVLETLRKLK
jgi:hypothetical protein